VSPKVLILLQTGKMSKLLEKFDELVQEMASMHEANRLLNERLAELNKNEKFILQQQQMYIDIGEYIH